ncbi:MAG TPA: hypothetical protein DCX07_08795 [Phycisphaerales bacterium]|nr:hypothetical protein [Phycisphaerales bacterium]
MARAREIAEAPSRSRYGFGALRHYDDIFRHTLELVVESGVFARVGSPFGMPEWFFDGPFFHRRFGRGYPHPSGFFVELLGSPGCFAPEPLWALFWAMAAAEHEFVTRFVPYWSHEERLTGHLVSLMVNRLETLASSWHELCAGSSDARESRCSIYYADTATARRESTTGADLGIIVHANLFGREEFFKVVRLQAKKVGASGQARIDLDQAKAMLGRKGLGYYMLYHAWEESGWNLAPTIVSASRFEDDIKKAQEQKSSRTLGEVSAEGRSAGFDFASFITFALMDEGSEQGVLVRDPCSAGHVIMGGTPAPSRVLVITLGGSAVPIDWDDVFGEYVTRESDEQ